MKEVVKVLNWFKGFFSSTSNLSMMRLLSLSLVWSGVLYCYICLIFGVHSYIGLELAALGLGAKWSQKYLETKK